MGSIEVSLGEYELEEPWGRLVEVGRSREHAPFEAPRSITTYVLRDRTIRSSSLSCKSVEDAVSLARFLDAHLAELRRFLLEQMPADHARLRALETDVSGRDCITNWSFSTGDADPDASTRDAVQALHDGFLARLAPVPIAEAKSDPALGGGKAVLAVCGEDALRIDVQEPSGPAYRGVQLAAAAALVAAMR